MSSDGACVTIGVFDGVHRGHQALIGHAREQAGGLRCVVVTFDPNPLEVLRPEQAPTRLTSIERRVALIEALGVDEVVVLPFTPDLAAMSAEDFTAEILQQQLTTGMVVVGEGFRFGNRAKGSAQTLQDAGIEVIEYALVGSDEPISSTRIRAAIASGDVASAAVMLGRPNEVDGIVVRGQQRGRDLGYPTANVRHHPRAAVPADGVYAGYGHVAGSRHPAAISVGSNPHFGGQRRTVEAYLLDFDGDLYDHPIRVEFEARLRGMQAFADLDALVSQMAADVARTRTIVGL